MSRELEHIAPEALELPPPERAELAKRLLESLDDLSESECDQLWAAEAARRFAEYKTGNMETVSYDEVFASLPARKR